MQLATLSFDCPLCGYETLSIHIPQHTRYGLDQVQCSLCGHRVSDDEINIQMGQVLKQKLSQYIWRR